MNIWFGAEAESFITAIGKGKVRDPSLAASDCLEQLQTMVPFLRGHSSSGIFLGNGQRAYTDRGEGVHFESSSAEVCDPWQYVAHVAAMERHLVRVLRALNARNNGHTYNAYRVNVDYSNTPSLRSAPATFATWGFHESWGCSSNLDVFRETLPLFLISRPILCGSGGFNSRSAGIEWTLSTRAHHLERDCGENSTRDRPLLHMKDESLSSAGGHRLHLICGEPLASQRGNFVRCATGLVVALTDAGWRPEVGSTRQSNVVALRAIAGDVTGKLVKVVLANGARMNAIELQRYFKNAVEKAAHDKPDILPHWALPVCKEWERLLDLLEHGGPDALAPHLDWALKYKLLTRRLHGLGWDWPRVELWSRAYHEIVKAVHAAPAANPDTRPTLEVLLASISNHAVVKQRATELADAGMTFTAAGVRAFETLKDEFLAADLRFSQIDGGVWDQLDAQGLLDHRIGVSVEDIEHAMHHPPPKGRAKIRGEFVRQHARKSGFAVDWQGCYELENRRVLVLSHPGCADGAWEPIPPDDECSDSRRLSLHELMALQQFHTLNSQIAERDFEAFRQLLPQALALVPQACTPNVYRSLDALGGILWNEEQPEYEDVVRAQLWLAEKLRLSRAITTTQNLVGMAALVRGDHLEARQWFERSFQRWQSEASPDLNEIRNVRVNCALCHAELAALCRHPAEIDAHLEAAEQDLAESRHLRKARAFRYYKVYKTKAQLALVEGDARRAERYLNFMRNWCRRLGFTPHAWALKLVPIATGGHPAPRAPAPRQALWHEPQPAADAVPF